MKVTIEPTRTKYDGIKATIYTTSEFMGNVVKREVRLFATGTKPYAQYPSVPFAEFKKKGGRKLLCATISGFRPFIVIVKGWDQPNPGEMFGKPEVDSNGTGFAQGRFSAFDAGWTADFEAEILSKVTGEVLVDVRKK